MKRQLLMCLLAAVLITGCATNGMDTEGSYNLVLSGNQDFSVIAEKEWKLLEVFVDGKDTQFKRDNQPDAFSGDIFTLKFTGGVIGGVGAPNRYSGQYTLSTNQGLSVSPLRSTLMASFLEPVNLSEHDFFGYIQSARVWGLTEDGSVLEILSASSENKPVRMVFGL